MKKLHYPRHDHPQKKLLGFIDGLEGGFAIFAGIVAGLSFTTLNRNVLIATAIVGIIVNAVNAATIRYSSEHYYDELDGHEKSHPFKQYFVPAIIEFILYMIISVLSVLPLIFMPSLSAAVLKMIIVCLVILFISGAIRGTLLNTHPVRDGIELVIGGSIMIGIGALAGYVATHIIANL